MQRTLVVGHLSALAVYLGSTVYLALLVEVAARKTDDARLRRERLRDLFVVYNPLAIAALGVVLMTGAWALTPYKEALGAEYFNTVGRVLAMKLALAFLLIISATWVCFGIGHRIVRAHDADMPVTLAELRSVQSRLRIAFVLVFALAAATLWVAMGIQAPTLNS